MINIVVVGESPLVEDLGELAVQAGHTLALYLVEQLADATALTRLGDEVRAAQVVVEAHNESKTAKREAVQLLDALLPPERPLLSACLAAATTEIASWTRQPERVAGWSALPPLEAGGVIELAAGLRTTPETLGAAEQFFHALGLETLRVSDGPGLVRARIVCCLANEAATALSEQVASPADIDTAMRLGTNYPRGPLAWADLIGVDVVLGTLTGLFEEYGEERYRPAPLIKRMVQAGWLGKKSGKGFFEY